MIKNFKGEYAWLSNFAPVTILFGNIEYPSVENAYMSAKNDTPEWKEFCANHEPNVVKKQSKTIILRPDWDRIKLSVMYKCLKAKYIQEPYRTKLLETGFENIQEGNYWNDEFWGINLKTGDGENFLGRLIMEIRRMLRSGELK